MVQRLRPCASSGEGEGLISVWGTKTAHAMQQTNKQTKDKDEEKVPALKRGSGIFKLVLKTLFRCLLLMALPLPC